MLMFVLALVAAEPAAATGPVTVTAPARPAPKVSKLDEVSCKWMVGKGGSAGQVCATKDQWRREQINRQQAVDEFQRRSLMFNTH